MEEIALQNETSGILVEKQANEISNCYFVKTILMVVIVFYHSICFWTGNWFTKNPVFSSDILNWLAQWIGGWHIYTFVLVSGYIFYYGKYEKNKYQCLLPFICSKSKRLLIPYIFVVAIWVLPITMMFFKFDIYTVFYRYIIAASPSQLWFLWMLFWCFIIVWLLSDFIKKHDIMGFLIAVILYGVGLVGPKMAPNIFSIWTACQFVFFFWLGFKIRQHSSNLIRKIHPGFWLIADILIFALMQYLSQYDNILVKIFNMGITFIVHIIGAIMAFTILQKIAEHTPWRNSKIFTFLCKRSMPVYLFHQQVIYFFIYWLNGMVNPYINVAVNFAGAMTISLLISTVLMKFKWTRFLIGEK